MDGPLQIAHDMNIVAQESLKNSHLFKDHTFAKLNFMKISVKGLRTKCGLFSERAIHFSNLPISKGKIFQKNYPELEI